METKFFEDFGVIKVIHPDDTNADNLGLNPGFRSEIDEFGFYSGSNQIVITADTKTCGRVTIQWDNVTPEYFEHEGRQVNTRKFLDREKEVCTMDCFCLMKGQGCKYTGFQSRHNPKKCYCHKFYSVVYPEDE